MENRKNENSMNLAGDIRKEMDEIQKMQATTPLILSMVTNTCADLTTVICCQSKLKLKDDNE